MTMMDPMIEEEEKSCSPIITAHPLITKRRDRHDRNRNRNRRSSITHLRTYCESLSASIAPDNEMGLQTMGLRLSSDNRAKLQAAIEDTTVWIEEQDNNAVTNIDDSDYVELSDDVLEAKEFFDTFIRCINLRFGRTPSRDFLAFRYPVDWSVLDNDKTGH